MCKNEKYNFECCYCGSHKLGFQKYVKSITPVFLQEDSHIEYDLPVIDEGDCLATLYGYMCVSCERLVEHCGCVIATEKEFKQLTSMDPKVRAKEQQDYEELIEAQINEQEQREGEHTICHEEVSPAEKLALTQQD